MSLQIKMGRGALPVLLSAILFCAVVPVSADNTGDHHVRVHDYYKMRETLQARYIESGQLHDTRTILRNQPVELVGRIVGRQVPVGDDCQSITYILEAPRSEATFIINSPNSHSMIDVNRIVHVIVMLPENARPNDPLVQKAIICENDLPEEDRHYARVQAQALQAKTQAVDAADEVSACADTGGAAAGNGMPADTTPVSHVVTAPPPAETTLQPDPPARPGSEFPGADQASASNRQLEVWVKWVREQNSRLSAQEAEFIVRNVLYYSALYGVDHRLSFAMIKCESNFNPRCRSHAGAMGLTQLMPGTAKGLGVTDPWDIEQNIRGGIQYLSKQLYAYSDRSNYEQFALGLASYNAGPNRVKRANGVPNIPETVRYVKKVGDLFSKFHADGMP